ncbi:unnamed protein product [Scytosiphon promiscuus]
MAGMATPQDWTLGFDELNRVCWLHKATKVKVYPQSPPEAAAGLSTIAGAGPNIPTAASFTPATGSIYDALLKDALAGAWKEYQTDGDDNKRYWYNKITNQTTWEMPTEVSPTKPPPPPPQPSATPAPPAPPAPKEPSPPKGKGGGKEVAKKKDEKDQWKAMFTDKGRKYWYNEETGDSQFETPYCLRKYR